MLLFYDPPHLLKALRNNFLKYNILYGPKSASWKYIYDFFKQDKTMTYYLCPELTQNHLIPVGRRKMKVKLAAQVFSYSVGAAICTYVAGGLLSGIAAETADFIIKIDSLFDSFNSRTLKAKKKYLCAATQTSGHIEFWREMLDFVSAWTFVDSNKNIRYTHCKGG